MPEGMHSRLQVLRGSTPVVGAREALAHDGALGDRRGLLREAGARGE